MLFRKKKFRWDRKEEDLIWHVPEKEAKSPYNDVPDRIVVGLGECAVLYSRFGYQRVDGPIEENVSRKKVMGIVWVNTQEWKEKGRGGLMWGCGPKSLAGDAALLTEDGVPIRTYGILRLQIFNPTIFVQKVVSGESRYSNMEVKDWVLTCICRTFRDMLRKHKTTYQLLKEELHRFEVDLECELEQILKEYGIKVVSNSLCIEGLKTCDANT